VYNPVSRQWSIYGSSVKTGVFDPLQVGQFNNGHGEFSGQDTWEGRAVTVRFLWDAVSHDKTHFEQTARLPTAPSAASAVTQLVRGDSS
jgi:hypothetical protein